MPLNATCITRRFTRAARSRSKRTPNLPDASVSDEHAELFVLLGTCYLRDLNSTNGIWRLHAGEKVRLRSGYVAFEPMVNFGQVGVRGGDVPGVANGAPLRHTLSKSEGARTRRDGQPTPGSLHGKKNAGCCPPTHGTTNTLHVSRQFQRLASPGPSVSPSSTQSVSSECRNEQALTKRPLR